MNEGNRAFAALLDGLTDGNGVEQRLVLVDPDDVGLLQRGATAPSQHPFAAVRPILMLSDAAEIAQSERIASLIQLEK